MSLLAVTALMAKHFQGQRPGLQSDLKTSLDRFWGNSRTEAEVTGAGQVRVRVWTEPSLRGTQRNWTFALARWLAARHPEVKIGNLAVTDGESSQFLEEDKKSDPGDTYLHVRYFEAARSQMLQRETQSELDRKMGSAQTLVLVDVTNLKPVTSWLPNVPGDIGKSSATYGSMPNEEYPGQSAFAIARIDACIVIRRESQREQATQIVAASLPFDKGRGDRLRAVLLPETP